MSQTRQIIEEIAKTILAEGGQALLVGGCVRDRLMGREAKDWDLEVYGIEPVRLPELLGQFGKVNAVGEAFKVYKLGSDLDISLPRYERKQGQGHRSFLIQGDPRMSFTEAARRRDFTVNAILQNPLSGEIIDPFHGESDIHGKILRAVSADTFVEDSLRVLRAAQLAARFEFDIAPETVALCREIDLSDLPPERIWGEMEKLLLQAAHPSLGLRVLRELRAIERVFPELNELIDVPQDPEWHPEGDVFVHTGLVLDRAHELIGGLDYPRQVVVMLAALCHDLGKPATTEFLEGHWRSRGHEEAGVSPTISLLDRLNMYTLSGYDVRGQVIALVREHLKPGEFYKKREQVGDGAFRRLARKCELDLLYRVARADSLGRNADWVPREMWYDAAAQDWFINRAKELEVDQSPPAPLLMGRHLLELGIEPGPEIGQITRAVYEMQLDGQVQTLDQAKDAARKFLSPDSEFIDSD